MFLQWIEGRVEEKTRPEIQEHLDGCEGCRSYFDKMSFLMSELDTAAPPRLKPDAFLPTRIRALAEQRRARKAAGKRFAWGRVSLVGASFLLAVTAGVILGTGLTSASYSSEETELVQSYSTALSSSGFVDSWQEVVEPDVEESTQ